MQWLSEHSSALNFFVNLGMLGVWVVYLQLFLYTYLRSRKPRLLISRASGSDIDSVCLVSNMSQEPVYAQNIYCTIHHENGSCSATITDRHILQRSGRDRSPEGVTPQGPLNRGDFMSIGTFRNLLQITSDYAEDCPSDLEKLGESIQSVEIMIVAAFGGDDLEIAARRTFRIDASREAWGLIPESPSTKQISSRKERKEIRQMIKDELAQR